MRFSHVVRDGLPSAVLTEEARLGRPARDRPAGRERPRSPAPSWARPPRTWCGPRRARAGHARRVPRTPAAALSRTTAVPSAETALRFYVNMLHGVAEELVVLSVTEQMEENFPYDKEFSYLGTHGITCRFVVETGRPIDDHPDGGGAREVPT
ncbi:MAG: hypothetical protein MZV64_25960 [Ignavibacteriales bacterium]|nr:hypothetical protein [Ignavibacteriales bacterium]